MLPSILGNADASGSSFWLPERASTFADGVDATFNFILYLCVFFFLLVTVLTVVFVLKYRHRPGGAARDTAAGHSTALELTWTIIPTILVLVIFYVGFRGYLQASVVPVNAYEVNVTGKMWAWNFSYPAMNGNPVNTPELYVPLNKPIRVVLASDDVIHSLFIPAFRVKKDATPGRYNRMWFQANRLGDYDIYCAEYCGVNHSQMRSVVHVLSEDDFRRKMEELSDWTKTKSPVQAGEEFYRTKGCITCHTIDGTRSAGPSWKDMFGSEVPIEGGTKVLADEAYVMESIRLPAAKIHQGFANQMPPFPKSQLSDLDVSAIIAYMKSISSNYKGDLTPLKEVRPASAPNAAPK